MERMNHVCYIPEMRANWTSWAGRGEDILTTSEDRTQVTGFTKKSFDLIIFSVEFLYITYRNWFVFLDGYMLLLFLKIFWDRW